MPKLLGFKDGGYDFQMTLKQDDNFGMRKRKSTLTYYILADTLDQDQYEIVACEGLPQLGQSIKGEAASGIKAKEVNRIIHPVTGTPAGLWEVVVDTDSNVNVSTFGPGAGGRNLDPTDFSPVYEWVTEHDDVLVERETVPYQIIIGNEPGPVQPPRLITTSAGEPIVHEEKVARPVLIVTRYEVAPFNPLKIFVYCGKINNLEFRGAPPGTAYMQDMTAPEEIIEGIKWIKATYRIKFKLEADPVSGSLRSFTWSFRPLDQGTYFLDQDGNKKQFTDIDGNAIVGNLDGNGHQANQGADPAFLNYLTKPLANFNDLAL